VALRSGLGAVEKIKALAPASHVISSRFSGSSHERSNQRSEGGRSRKFEVQNIEVHEHASLLHVFLHMKVFRDVMLFIGIIPEDLNLQQYLCEILSLACRSSYLHPVSHEVPEPKCCGKLLTHTCYRFVHFNLLHIVLIT
jgi:hypothetical protein